MRKTEKDMSMTIIGSCLTKMISQITILTKPYVWQRPTVFLWLTAIKLSNIGFFFILTCIAALFTETIMSKCLANC